MVQLESGAHAINPCFLKEIVRFFLSRAIQELESSVQRLESYS